MNEESRRQLRRANVVARGYILAAKCSKSRDCLLYTSPSPRDMRRSRMPSSA